MHVEFLVEEPSAEAALVNIVPKILQDITFRIHPFQGKQDLLNKLLPRLRGYKDWLPEDWKIVVLIDADDEDCKGLKVKLEEKADRAGLMTKSRRTGEPYFQVLNRLAIEELEAWFFGDVEALHYVYPRVSLNLEKKAKYRDPDAIRGGTWEALERELKKTGYFRGGFSKISVARGVSAHMVPERNRSKSFQVFHNGLVSLLEA
jgi:hypothetical protein